MTELLLVQIAGAALVHLADCLADSVARAVAVGLLRAAQHPRAHLRRGELQPELREHLRALALRLRGAGPRRGAGAAAARGSAGVGRGLQLGAVTAGHAVLLLLLCGRRWRRGNPRHMRRREWRSVGVLRPLRCLQRAWRAPQQRRLARRVHRPHEDVLPTLPTPAHPLEPARAERLRRCRAWVSARGPWDTAPQLASQLRDGGGRLSQRGRQLRAD